MSSAGVTLAHPVNMKDLKLLLQNVSPDVAVCIRGRHAIGKSEGTYQAAAEKRSDLYKDPDFCKEMVKAWGGQVKHAHHGIVKEWKYDYGLPVMERRLSQMTEGDTIGLPGKSEHGTVFNACDWLVVCCKFPALLFLDERNRALPGVKQSVFQICDSKAFYGNFLHEETQVVIAENVGDEYIVEQCDPAEISRTAVVDLNPSLDDWLEYVEDKCDVATRQFIRSNPSRLEHTNANEPGKKYQDRRSWFKLDQELQRLNLFEDPSNHLFYVLSCSMLGTETGQHFTQFCKDFERQVSAKDVLKSWEKAKKRLAGNASVSNEMYIEIVDKLRDLLKEYKLNKQEAKQVALFMHDCPMEIVMVAWGAIHANQDNLITIHPMVEKLMIKVARGEEVGNLTVEDNDTDEKSKDDTKKVSVGAKKRGSKLKKKQK